MRVTVENVEPQGDYVLTYQQIVNKPGLYQPTSAPDGIYLLVSMFNPTLGQTHVSRVTQAGTLEGGPLGILYPASRWMKHTFREVHGTIKVECDGSELTEESVKDFLTSKGVGPLPVGVSPFNTNMEPENYEA